jgi:hypothetical protein
VVALAAAGLVLAGCGTSLSAIVGSTSTTQAPSDTSTPTSTAPSPSPSPSTTAPLDGEVAVAFPVVACSTSTGSALPNSGWKPSVLLAPIPTALVGKIEFYSDGVHTLLGPTGWTCSQTQSNQGSGGLVIYPYGSPDPPVNGPPAAGTEGVFALFDNTGHAPGVALVCPFFTVPMWQQEEANCSGSKPPGEQSSMPTPDIATVSDPPGVVGTLEGSGGVHPVTGAVIFPQVVPAVTNGSSVNVAEASCSLSDSALCPTVLSDFEVREFPVQGYSSTSR